MPKLFSSPDNNEQSANDYIERKRNLALYCDYSHEKGRKISQKYTNGKLKKAINHSSLLKITKGFFDYHQTIDISNNLVQSYEGEKFVYNKCKIPERTTNSNYTGILLVDEEENNQTIQDTKFDNVVNYNEIENKTITDVSKDVKTHKVKCFQYPYPNIMKKN
jgi:hypothetical protein